jgi:hypothetical protein
LRPILVRHCRVQRVPSVALEVAFGLRSSTSTGAAASLQVADLTMTESRVVSLQVLDPLGQASSCWSFRLVPAMASLLQAENAALLQQRHLRSSKRTGGRLLSARCRCRGNGRMYPEFPLYARRACVRAFQPGQLVPVAERGYPGSFLSWRAHGCARRIRVLPHALLSAAAAAL